MDSALAGALALSVAAAKPAVLEKFANIHSSTSPAGECQVVVEGFKESESLILITANIFVSHESQKGIVIGHKGAAHKKCQDSFLHRLYSVCAVPCAMPELDRNLPKVEQSAPTPDLADGPN